MSGNRKVKEARDLLLSEYQAVLSTHSVDVKGYPFGSIVPYCLNQQGEPIILISDIAQHTKNIVVNSKVSLTVAERDADDSQTAGRVTYIGNAIKLDEDDTDSIERYYSFFPQSRDYHKIHDFNFYTIQAVRIRFIGGFGQIYWIEQGDFLLANPFSYDEELQMINHMNADHPDAIKHYCELNGINYSIDDAPVMVGIDGEGFYLRTGVRIHRIKFSESVTKAAEVRASLVDMAKKDL